MVDLEIEEFTADEADKAGLTEALKRGEVKINGMYELTVNGITFDQNNFVFTDKNGNLRAGRFKDANELLEFEMCY